MDLDTITWALAEGQDAGEPFMVRFREFPADFPRGRYPTRLNLFWSMAEPDSNGLASVAEAARLESFENRLVAAVEPDLHSIFVAALTGKAMREFVFQTADVPGFLRRLTEMPQEAERYPLRIEKYEDEAWEYFDQVTTPTEV